ncbi:MAG: DNA polymerase Y family protein [Alphaproteobacteria bacterium]|nr:DNA polymerase Y family protein [Alphaproteobacteria bacterium]
MRRRIVSLWFPRLATDRILRDRGPEPDARPLAAVIESGNRILLSGVTLAAERGGLAPGMTLADARAVAAHLVTVPADPRADAALLSRLARWAGRYTPIVALDGADGLFLDATGCTHLFGGEAAMLADMAARLEGLGFAVSGALADTPGAAWALARHGRQGGIAPPGGTARALEKLPVGALRLDREIAAGLARLGLRRIGDLYGLPRGALAARFGAKTVLRLDRALGHAEEPLEAARVSGPLRTRISFAEPVAARSDIDAALAWLLDELCGRLEGLGRGARRLELACHRVDGTAQMLAIGTARPLRDAAALARLFRDRLEGIDPGFGIEAMILSAPVSEVLAPAQETMGARRDPQEGAAALIDRLGNRLGFGRVRRAALVDSHLPDRAWRPVSPVETAEAPPGPAVPLRPTRLFARPEPVAAEAGMEGGPPAAFRWRGRRHAVCAAEGPERIAPEWWRDDPAWCDGARDYWRVEDAAGRRYWLCRAGRPPRWCLHGLFV